MARVRKPQPTLDLLSFSTPEQKVLRLLLSEPTTSFSVRVIASKLKGVRGLGGAEGLARILKELEQLGFVDFVDNQRAVRLRDDNPVAQHLKVFLAICDLEGLKQLLEPISTKGILFGSRAQGRARSDSNYNVYVVSDNIEQVQQIAAGHPLGKNLAVMAVSPDDYERLEKENSRLHEELSKGVVLWGSSGW